MFLVCCGLFFVVCCIDVRVVGLLSYLRSGLDGAPTAAKSSPSPASSQPLILTSEPAPVLAEPSPKPSTPVSKQPAANTLTVLASVLVQMKARQASMGEMQPIVDAMAQILASGQGAPASTPVVLPNPTSPASPPPNKAPESKPDSSEAAAPPVSQAVPAASSAAGPHVKVEALSPQALPATSVVDQRCNSQSHASEYKAFNRFCESNPNAQEMRRAFE